MTTKLPTLTLVKKFLWDYTPVLVAFGMMLLLCLGIRERYKHKDMPPGYSLVCEPGGKYAYKVDDWVHDAFASTSKQVVIYHAWRNYESRMRMEKILWPTYNWKDCDK